MRIPDYNNMRQQLTNTHIVLIESMTDKRVLKTFVEMFGEHRIPKTKIDINKQQCLKCGCLVCLCKI